MERNHEEIQEFILHPANRNFLLQQLEVKNRVLVGKATREERTQNEIRTQRFLLKAAFGNHVFRGSHGKAFKAIAEYRRGYTLKGTSAIEFARKLSIGGGKLVWALSALDPDKLEHLSDDDKHVLIHELKGSAAYFALTGTAL